VAIAESPLLSVTVRPPAGAAVERVIGNATDCPTPTVSPVGSVIVPGATTVTFAVAGTTLVPLAVITVEPGATPVTGTFTEVAPVENVTAGTTVAAPVFEELRLIITPPAGAGAGSVSVRFCVVVPVIVRVFGLNAGDTLTCTVWLPGI